jgi:hypothetical protein
MEQMQPSMLPAEPPASTDPTAPPQPLSETASAPEATIAVWQDSALPTAVELDPRTGEPRRPWTVWSSTISGLLAVAVMIAALLWSYWQAVTNFSEAAWLFGRVAEPKPFAQVGLVAAVTATTLIAAAAAAITAFYGWWGYRWSRIAGIIAAVTSALMLLLNPVGWAAIPLTVISAAALWLPPTTRFFTGWHGLRHPDLAVRPPVTSVHYGPLPRYRSS